MSRRRHHRRHGGSKNFVIRPGNGGYHWTFSPGIFQAQIRHFSKLPKMSPIVRLKNGYKFIPYPNTF